MNHVLQNVYKINPWLLLTRKKETPVSCGQIAVPLRTQHGTQIIYAGLTPTCSLLFAVQSKAVNSTIWCQTLQSPSWVAVLGKHLRGLPCHPFQPGLPFDLYSLPLKEPDWPDPFSWGPSYVPLSPGPCPSARQFPFHFICRNEDNNASVSTTCVPSIVLWSLSHLVLPHELVLL